MKTIRHALGAIALGALALAAPARAQEPLAIATLPQGSLGYSIAAAMAKVVSEETGLSVRAVGQGGSNVYLPQVAQGRIAFGTSNTFEAVFATEGTGNFEGRPNPDLRVAALLVPFQVGFMVPADGDVRTVADLEGRPVAGGYARQRLVGVIQDAVLEASGLSPDAVSTVPVANFVEGANLLAQGRLDAVLLSPGSGVVKQTDAARPVRFLGIEDTEEARAVIADALPGATLTLVEPSERLPEIAEPVHLVGYQYALMAGAGVPDETVHAVVAALHGGQPALAEALGVFGGFDPSAMAAALEGASFHPGAVRFYEEAGIWPGE